MKGISPRQRDALAFVAEYTTSHGYPPSHRDIGDTLGVTLNAVNDLLLALARKGFLTIAPKISRGLVLTPAGHAELHPTTDKGRSTECDTSTHPSSETC